MEQQAKKCAGSYTRTGAGQADVAQTGFEIHGFKRNVTARCPICGRRVRCQKNGRFIGQHIDKRGAVVAPVAKTNAQQYAEAIEANNREIDDLRREIETKTTHIKHLKLRNADLAARIEKENS